MKSNSVTKSPLQLARADYKPKLPATLTGNILVKEGAVTQSVAHQKEINKMFPITYGLPILNIESGSEPLKSSALKCWSYTFRRPSSRRT